MENSEDKSVQRRPAFVCPACLSELTCVTDDRYRCDREDLTFRKLDDIWRFIPDERLSHFKQFLEEYNHVRHYEGRGSDDPDYYRSLPFKDLSGKDVLSWRIRATSFRSLLKNVIRPLESEFHRPLSILDLGAGNCWLSNQLAERGHELVAVDLSCDTLDGLASKRHFQTKFTAVQAEFSRLPLPDDQFELVIFNASFHYSEDYVSTLIDVLRVLKNDGQLVIMDTPVYHDSRSGDQMVREREDAFEKRFGFRSDSLSSKNYLTFKEIEDLGQTLNISWKVIKPYYGIRWHLKPFLAKVRELREPAKFILVAGRRKDQQKS